MTDPLPLTIHQLNARESARVAELSAFWQKVQHEPVNRRPLSVDAGRKYQRACNQPGVSVWQVDELGNVVAKFSSGRDAGAKCRVKFQSLNLSIQKGRALRDGRRFIRLPKEGGSND